MGIFDVFTGDSASNAANANRGAYTDYANAGYGFLDKGLADAGGAIKSGIDAYTPLANLGVNYSKAGSLLSDALGVNGADGNARAVSAYHTAPGYQFATGQALDAATRAGNRMGATGNTIDEVTKRAAGYADQDYGNWLSNLGGMAGQGITATGAAASGQQTGYNTLGGAYMTTANDKTNVAGNMASGIANSNTAAANSQMQASSNFWNGLMSLGGNAAKGYFGGGKTG